MQSQILKVNERKFYGTDNIVNKINKQTQFTEKKTRSLLAHKKNVHSKILRQLGIKNCTMKLPF